MKCYNCGMQLEDLRRDPIYQLFGEVPICQPCKNKLLDGASNSLDAEFYDICFKELDKDYQTGFYFKFDKSEIKFIADKMKELLSPYITQKEIDTFQENMGLLFLTHDNSSIPAYCVEVEIMKVLYSVFPEVYYATVREDRLRVLKDNIISETATAFKKRRTPLTYKMECMRAADMFINSLKLKVIEERVK